MRSVHREPLHAPGRRVFQDNQACPSRIPARNNTGGNDGISSVHPIGDECGEQTQRRTGALACPAEHKHRWQAGRLMLGSRARAPRPTCVCSKIGAGERITSRGIPIVHQSRRPLSFTDKCEKMAGYRQTDSRLKNRHFRHRRSNVNRHIAFNPSSCP